MSKGFLIPRFGTGQRLQGHDESSNFERNKKLIWEAVGIAVKSNPRTKETEQEKINYEVKQIQQLSDVDEEEKS